MGAIKRRFPKEIILEVLRRIELGTPLPQLRHEYGFSQASYYYWRAKYYGTQWGDRRKYSELEEENRKLKVLLAEAFIKLESRAPSGERDTRDKQWPADMLTSEMDR